jgi:hypothetical protein
LVGIQVLEALDGLQWLRTGEEVAKRFSISQPTVTRYCSKALQVFDLELERRDGEWELNGDQTILLMQRRVHQMARLQGLSALRMEAAYWNATTYCSTLPQGWLLGQSNMVGISRNFRLLRERVIDCWVAGLPDIPQCDDPELGAVVLSDMPVFFTCSPEHPILRRQQIDYCDIAEFPTLALPKGAYPLVERSLGALGLWNDGVRMTRYRRDAWEGRSEADLVIGYATPLSMMVSGGNLCRLPLLLPFRSGDALVARRELIGHPVFDALLDHLNARIALLSDDIEELNHVCAL